MSLYFQTPDSQSLCQKRLYLRYRTPTIIRHESVWVFHFSVHQQVALRCWENNTWTPGTATLFGNGIIYNATTCSLTTPEFRTLPELIGRTSTAIEATHFYVPDTIKIVAPHELQEIEKTISSGTNQLDEIQSQVAIPRHMNDIGPLIHSNRTAERREQQWRWYLILPTAFCTLIVLYFICYSLRFYLRRICLTCQTQNGTLVQTTNEQASTSNTSDTQHNPETTPSNDPGKQVAFTINPFHPKD
jgi:hypothetical protein